MRIRRIFYLAVIAVMISAVTASALSLGDFIPQKLLPQEETTLAPENSLIPRQDESVYAVLRLDDTGVFLRWLLSEDNISLFMPLILRSKDSSDIIGVLEFVRAFAEKTPLKSAAVISVFPGGFHG